VNSVLFQSANSKKHTAKRVAPKKSIENLQETEKLYLQLEHVVDLWAEKYGQLVPLVENYITSIGKMYRDPKPETWLYHDDDEDTWPNTSRDNDERYQINI
jgi:hypothetical protein